MRARAHTPCRTQFGLFATLAHTPKKQGTSGSGST